MLEMTKEDLGAAGDLAYGYGWQRKIAMMLAINERTVRRWAAGQVAVPRKVAPRLLAVLQVRRKKMDDVMARLLELSRERPQ